MTMVTMSRRCLLLAGAALLGGCAALPGGEPPRVSFVGIEAAPSEGMELRFTVKLRVQNPGEAILEIDGVVLDLEVRGMGFASGVSPVKASVPRFGETVITVPVTVPATAVLRQALGLMGASDVRKIEFKLSGRLAAGAFGGHRFNSSGELDWPPGGNRSPAPTPK